MRAEIVVVSVLTKKSKYHIIDKGMCSGGKLNTATFLIEEDFTMLPGNGEEIEVVGCCPTCGHYTHKKGLQSEVYYGETVRDVQVLLECKQCRTQLLVKRGNPFSKVIRDYAKILEVANKGAEVTPLISNLATVLVEVFEEGVLKESEIAKKYVAKGRSERELYLMLLIVKKVDEQIKINTQIVTPETLQKYTKGFILH